MPTGKKDILTTQTNKINYLKEQLQKREEAKRKASQVEKNKKAIARLQAQLKAKQEQHKKKGAR